MTQPRRFKRFRIDEISAVDLPAQAPATMSILKRADEGDKMSRSSWMQPRNNATDEPSNADIALEHARHIGDQYRRMRHHLMKSESGDGMSKVEIGQKMMDALEVAATEILKRERHLTKERAFARVYQDPANRSIAKAERWAHGFRELPVETAATGCESRRPRP